MPMVNQQFATSVHIMISLGYLSQQKAIKTADCKLANSDMLAESIRTNPVVVRRLLSQLNKAGLIKTARGKKGGVQLNKPATEIDLSDIYKAIELDAPVKPHNKPATKDCPVSCTMHEIMCSVADGYTKASLKYLETIKLSDLIKKIKTNKS